MVGAAPTARAPRTRSDRTRRLCTASGLVVCLLLAGVSAGAALARVDAAGHRGAHRASLSALWAVEVDRHSQFLLAPDSLARLEKAGINALVVDPEKINRRQLRKTQTVALRESLTLIAVMPKKRSSQAARDIWTQCHKAHARSRLLCARRAANPVAAKKLAQRSRNEDLVVLRVSTPSGLVALRSARKGRFHIVALLRLSARTTFSSETWQTAISTAANSALVDLGVSPSGSASERGLWSYLGLLQQATTPTTPGALAQTSATDTTVSFSWSAASDDLGVTGYTVYRNGTPVSTTTSTHFTVSGLICSGTFTFAVDAYDAAGNHSAPASMNASTTPCFSDTTPPSTPTGLVTSGATQWSVALSWNPSTDNVGVAGYRLYVDGSQVGTSTATTYSFTLLNCGTTYSLGVAAFDASGNVSGVARMSAATAACTVSAPDVYLAQNTGGSGDGSSCANARPASYFNDASNWGSGRAIAPGKTVGLCGTITTTLTAQGDGATGSPVTILFEPGAKLSQPVCPTGGCLDLDQRSYITVDGGANGTIENTDNGTNLGHQSHTAGIEAMPCNHCEIRNLLIQNMYVHVGTGNEVDNSSETCIKINGTGVSVHDNVMHDASWCLRFMTFGGNSGRFYNNEIYNVDHAFIFTGLNGSAIGDVFFYSNHVHDFGNWDNTANSYHHDGIHCYTGGTTGMTINNLYVYNNVFDGNIGNNATTWIFMEGTGSNTACSTPSSHMWFFNNVFHSSGPKPAAYAPMIETNNGTVFTANNTEIFNNPGDVRGVGLQAPNGATVVNNVVGGFNKLVNIYSGTGAGGPPLELDHNAYTYCPPGGGVGQSYNCFDGERDWATYHAANEPHSVADVYSTAVGSNAAGVGENLTWMCSGALVPLCSDINGDSRPATGQWNAGAFG